MPRSSRPTGGQRRAEAIAPPHARLQQAREQRPELRERRESLRLRARLQKRYGLPRGSVTSRAPDTRTRDRPSARPDDPRRYNGVQLAASSPLQIATAAAAPAAPLLGRRAGPRGSVLAARPVAQLARSEAPRPDRDARRGVRQPGRRPAPQRCSNSCTRSRHRVRQVFVSRTPTTSYNTPTCPSRPAATRRRPRSRPGAAARLRSFTSAQRLDLRIPSPRRGCVLQLGLPVRDRLTVEEPAHLSAPSFSPTTTSWRSWLPHLTSHGRTRTIGRRPRSFAAIFLQQDRLSHLEHALEGVVACWTLDGRRDGSCSEDLLQQHEHLHQACRVPDGSGSRSTSRDGTLVETSAGWKFSIKSSRAMDPFSS